ncbi:MAG TPA: PKD domain-containing protein [Steroidobacteraceae bacterium]
MSAQQSDTQAIETVSYTVTDKYFGKPYIDRDEWRDEPVRHRHIHGGFEGTATRFTFYFPTPEHYKGRMFQPLEGAHAGHEDAFAGPMGQMLGGLEMMGHRLGGYMVESNSGHIGDDIDPHGGDDPTLYGYRASVEAARFSKHVAAQVYGSAPAYCYVWGGSGGGRRSPLCLEYGADVYAGALPFMGGGNVEKHGTKSRVRSEAPICFGSMFNVQRLLSRDDKLEGVINAMQPGGSGNPFDGLESHEREELANLYRLGYPRGDEFMIAHPMGQMWLWTSIAELLLEEDGDYFNAFWTRPGYVGHDSPQHVTKDLIDVTKPVSRVLTAQALLADPGFSAPEYAAIRTMAGIMAATTNRYDLPVAIEVKGTGAGYGQGAGVRVVSGKAAGRQLYALEVCGDLFFCDGRREANLLRFTDVAAGDEVHIDNRAFLAFCYAYRHHISADPMFDFLRVNGEPLYPQHGLPLQSPLMGVPYSGQYEGKLLWVHHTHDSSLWPTQGVIYGQAVLDAQGPERTAQNFCMRWTENAEHISPAYLASSPTRATSTWLIDYMPIIEQSLVDLCDWAERGIEPVETKFSFADGKVTLPATARERGGIQPVVSVRAGGSSRANIRAGASVTLEVEGEAPPRAGSIIAVEWSLDGDGRFEAVEGIDGKSASVRLTKTHRYEKPGVYFATARVTSHMAGDVNAQHRRLVNVASARVVVS